MDFPEPLGPTMAMSSPAVAVKERWSRMREGLWGWGGRDVASPFGGAGGGLGGEFLERGVKEKERELMERVGVVMGCLLWRRGV